MMHNIFNEKQNIDKYKKSVHKSANYSMMIHH